jgi:Ser/Thr protein kinase RdoA (MazF antagonist)
MDNKIEAILKNFELELADYIRKPDGGIIRSHVLKCKDKLGNYLTVKVFDSNDSIAKDRFIGEVKHIKKIRSLLPTKFKKYIPKIKTFNLEDDNPYYIYDFIEGENLGVFVSDLGISHGKFTKSNFEKFIEFIDLIEQLQLGEDYEVSRWSQNNARKEIKIYLENTPDLSDPEIYDKIPKFYDKNLKNAFKSFVYSHRDLYPENILIEKDFSSSFTFLDWEYFGKVPLGFNAAFLYLMFWREEFWKAKVFAHFYNKYEKECNGKYLGSFLDSFSFCVVILASRFLYQAKKYSDSTSDSTWHAKRTFLHDLNNALNGSIVKPRSVKFYIQKSDIDKVAEVFGLGEVDDYEIFYSSKGNTVAKVVMISGEKYIFRFYSDMRTRFLVKRELRIFEQLKAAGIKTYKVFHTKDGSNIADIKLYGKSRRVAVLSYLEGKKIARKWSNPASTYNLAKTLRAIHDSGVVHGDFSKENVLFNKTKVVGVIDFEWGAFTMSNKVKRHDMAKAIALWMIDIRYKGISDEDFFEEFVKGYYKKNLKPEEKIEIIDLIETKIISEKDIFITTIDTNARRTHIRRFDDVLDRLKGLKESLSSNS